MALFFERLTGDMGWRVGISFSKQQRGIGGCLVGTPFSKQQFTGGGVYFAKKTMLHSPRWGHWLALPLDGVSCLHHFFVCKKKL